MTRATRADRMSALASAMVVGISAATLARRTREHQRHIALDPRTSPRTPEVSQPEVSLAPEPTPTPEEPPAPVVVDEPAASEPIDPAPPTPSTSVPDEVPAADTAPKAKAVAQPRAAKKSTAVPAPKAVSASSSTPAKRKAAAAKPGAATRSVRATASTTAPAAKRVRAATTPDTTVAKRKAAPAAPTSTSTPSGPRTAPTPKASAKPATDSIPTPVPETLAARSTHPVIRSVERRRTEPLPGRRARRPHLPKRRRQRRAGLIPAILMLLVGLALAVPWYRPGFGAEMTRWGHGIDHWSTSAGRAIGHWIDPPAPAPVVVQDPPILSSEPPAPVSHKAPRTAGVPQFLFVPLLQVDSPVVPISGNSGELLPPSDPQVIGWWEQGPKPGSTKGTAVLTGHTVHFGGGAFDHLSFLKVGEHFSIQTDHGTIRYVIVHMHKYETGTLARDSSSLFQLSGPPRVLLVTCSGWNGHIYLENTVVTGVPVS